MDFKALLAKYLPQILSWIQGQAIKQFQNPDAAQAVPSKETKAVSFKLTRKQLRPDGIFSELIDQDGKLVACTLEHSYDNLPKIPNGTFDCIRGPHRLHGMTEDFITFEIRGIIGHSDLLFHWGNYNKDSEGCVLLGAAIAESTQGQWITSSKVTFSKFMTSLDGVNSFKLTVC